MIPVNIFALYVENKIEMLYLKRLLNKTRIKKTRSACLLHTSNLHLMLIVVLHLVNILRILSDNFTSFSHIPSHPTLNTYKLIIDYSELFFWLPSGQQYQFFLSFSPLENLIYPKVTDKHWKRHTAVCWI